ncbi:MAG: hypothetical protein MUC51_17190 [Anaerolineae bacterium]|nr:hypothetical protein [Anaerolineae bacterium]
MAKNRIAIHRFIRLLRFGSGVASPGVGCGDALTATTGATATALGAATGAAAIATTGAGAAVTDAGGELVTTGGSAAAVGVRAGAGRVAGSTRNGLPGGG